MNRLDENMQLFTEIYNCYFQIVDEICKAKRIYIFGVRSTAAIAGFLAYYFQLIFDNVTVINTTSTTTMYEHIFRISGDDLIIGISFPRYSQSTIKGIRFAYDRGADVIVRGVRNATDFDVEYQLALINRSIYPALETMLVPASAEYQHFSSSMAREMIRYHQPLEKYIPASIIPMVRDMTESKGE